MDLRIKKTLFSLLKKVLSSRRNSYLLFVLPLSFIGLTCNTAHAFLQHWYFPRYIQDQKLEYITIENISAVDEDIWMNPPFNVDQEPLEYFETIPAHQTIKIPISKLDDFADSKFFHLKAHTKQLKIKGYIQLKDTSDKKTEFNIPQYSYGNDFLYINKLIKKQTITVYNISSLDQYIKVNDEERFLSSFSSLQIPISELNQVVIHSEHRIFAITNDDTQAFFIAPLKSQILKSTLSDKKHFFQVSNSEKGTSFIVAISDPSLIQQARRQLQYPNDLNLPRILSAQIGPTHGGYNQDLLDPHRAAWSWHVTQVYKFSSVGLDTCNGSPDIVEFFLPLWLQNNKPICFYDFKIIKELNIPQ